MGAASYILSTLIWKLGIDKVSYAGRRSATSPAVGAFTNTKWSRKPSLKAHLTVINL